MAELMQGPIPVKSANTQRVQDYLAAHTTPGTLLTYDQIAAGAKVPVDEVRRGRLRSAMRCQQRDGRHVWLTVRGVGVKLADFSETCDAAMGEIKRSNKAVSRGLRRLATVDPAKLDNAAMIRFNTAASHLGALKMVTTAKASKHIESAVQASAVRLPVEKTLAAFLPAVANGRDGK